MLVVRLLNKRATPSKNRHLIIERSLSCYNNHLSIYFQASEKARERVPPWGLIASRLMRVIVDLGVLEIPFVPHHGSASWQRLRPARQTHIPIFLRLPS